MNRHLGANEMLALLDRFQSVLQDFAVQEETLTSEFRTRTAAEGKAFESASEQQASRLSERIADAKNQLEADRKNSRAKFEKRKARITQAHLTCNRQVMEGTDREGRHKHWLQKSTVDAERKRDAALANAANALQNFNVKLAERRDSFLALERKARRAFRGYGFFFRFFSSAKPCPEFDLTLDENQLFEKLRLLESGTRDNLKRFKETIRHGWFGFFPIWLLNILVPSFAIVSLVFDLLGHYSIPFGAGILIIFITFARETRTPSHASSHRDCRQSGDGAPVA